MSRTKFASTLTDAQMKLARRFQAAGLATISQAVKAFENRNNTQINAWKEELKQKDAAAGNPWM